MLVLWGLLESLLDYLTKKKIYIFVFCINCKPARDNFVHELFDRVQQHIGLFAYGSSGGLPNFCSSANFRRFQRSRKSFRLCTPATWFGKYQNYAGFLFSTTNWKCHLVQVHCWLSCFSLSWWVHGYRNIRFSIQAATFCYGVEGKTVGSCIGNSPSIRVLSFSVHLSGSVAGCIFVIATL